MATINGVEVIGDKTAHDFDLLDKDDGINLANGVERNRKATEDNHEDIVLHRTDRDVHVTPAWKNSLVTKEILGLYWTAAQTADIINEISIAGGAKLVKVDELPETGKEQTIYLVPKADPQQGDIFDEYVWIDGKFEFIGTTKVDLSNYATKTELNAKANDADVLHKSGNETVSDVKTFSDGIVSNLLNGKTPELVEEQGDGYIRYASGLQICWGLAEVIIDFNWVTFPKTFVADDGIVVTTSAKDSNIMHINVTGTATAGFSAYIVNSVGSIYWQAIGYWK